MRRLDSAGYFFPQLREKFRDHAISGASFPVFCIEKLLSNDSLSVDKEIPRPRHALELPYCLGVQHLISLDRLGVRVGKQRKVNLATVGEILEYFYAVVADRSQLDPLSLESRSSALQLDQLTLAVRSPIG